MSVSGVSSDRNYIDLLNGTTSSSTVYNAVFSDDSDSSLSVSDFFNLMVTQLTNQDFMDPVDDSQYLAEMAQFATMEEMMELCQYSKQNYVMAMLGKEVTLSQTNIGGTTSTITGTVDKILFEDDDYKIYVNGQPYSYSKVTQVSTGESTSDTTSTTSEASEDVAEEE